MIGLYEYKASMPQFLPDWPHLIFLLTLNIVNSIMWGSYFISICYFFIYQSESDYSLFISSSGYIHFSTENFMISSLCIVE